MISITHQQQNMDPASWKLTGAKLRVKPINEYKPSEVDWGAHENHQNGHSITKVDWGDYDPTLYSMDGCILS